MNERGKTGGRPGRKPGPAPSLTRDAVAGAALAEGISVFSMPGVAARLGVGHSTLYRYVDSREDLVRAAIELAAARTAWPPADLPWRELLTGFADAVWEACEAFPGLAEVLLTTPASPPVMVDRLGRYGLALVGAGLSTRDAAVAVDFVGDLVLSSAVAMRGLDRTVPDATGTPSTAREQYRDAWAAAPPGAHPFEAEFAAEETWHGRGWFDDKLAIFLDGLATRLAPTAPGTTETSETPETRGTPGPPEENA
ncbi:TetR/AcrR family transcriptional regulator [Streptomyces sp. OUCMDZ-4982]|uniref:TetR/AcrR family transcriptional regulator n=1 Tax=Streptomyces sp. OUCMDZ-4982 TaxID=2973090 RepID=UPI00215D46F4|nr:TetR/AcrR family transcriptional regulator [Streptomyces sp. OUCMDZ-4982]MCR8943465.1 TetR/AcrR family transcriptional regulator [Streptomyces sp. OUCMDZ-4982]